MKKLFSIICLIFLTSSCALKFLIIPNIDFLVTNRITKNFNLNSDEKKKAKIQIRDFLEKSKPLFAPYVAKLQNLELKSLDIKKELSELNNLYFKLASKLSPIIAGLMSELDPAQQAYLLERLKDENEDIQKSISEFNIEKIYERYDYFFGKLNQKQKQIINSYASTIRELSRQRLKGREKIANLLPGIYKLKDQSLREEKITQLFIENSDRRKPDPERMKLIPYFETMFSSLDQKQLSLFDQRKLELSDWLEKFLKTQYR